MNMTSIQNDFEAVIGLEVHAQLATDSKIFCGCRARLLGGHGGESVADVAVNLNTCPVCSGHPGALPVLNRKAVEFAIMAGFATHCRINPRSVFARKSYFYPDLPKGYQISQYDEPFCINGRVRLAEGDVRIHRVHLEEDTAKNLHKTVNGKKVTLIDFNRSGVPLMEIVTEPDIHSGEHARLFLKKLHQIIRYLGVSDADMEKGSMRLTTSRPAGAAKLSIIWPIWP